MNETEEAHYQEFKKNTVLAGKGARFYGVIVVLCWVMWSVANEREILMLFSALTAFWIMTVVLWGVSAFIVRGVERERARMGVVEDGENREERKGP